MKKVIFNKRGVALILVLLMVSLIVSATVSLNRTTRDELYETANLSDGVRLFYLAKSGFYGGEAMLMQDGNTFDALTDDWAKMEAFSPQSESLFRAGYFLVKIEDETGKIPVNKLIDAKNAQNAYNINPPVKDVLLRLLRLKEFNLEEGKAEEIVASLKDWLDKDDAITDPAGAEKAYYQGLGKPYAVRNGFLDCIDDLLMIKGITKELYYGTKEKPALKDYLSVYGVDGDGKININTAPKLVLRSLSEKITPDIAEKMDEYRNLEKNQNELARTDWYKKVAGLEATDTKDIDALISTKSDYYTIHSSGILGKMKKDITATIKRQDRRSLDLLSWDVQ